MRILSELGSMQNGMQLPHTLSRFNLFDFSSLASQHSQLMNSGSGGHHTINPQMKGNPVLQNLDAAAAMSHFLFPPSFLAHGFGHGILPEESVKQNKLMMKKSDGKSFTIDSLLGLNRAVFHGTIIPTSQSGVNLSACHWRPDSEKPSTAEGRVPNGKNSRAHPYSSSHKQKGSSKSASGKLKIYKINNSLCYIQFQSYFVVFMQ